jgi:hypothetical protein
LLVFISGIFSIVLLGKKKPREVTKKMCFALLGVLIFVIVTYELIYMNYTITCFDSRSVISHADVLPEVKPDYDYWKKQGPDALVNLVQAYQCNSIKIWAFTDLAIPYYSLLALYIAGLAVLTSLLLQTSNLIRQP